jgi:hypothetical protein
MSGPKRKRLATGRALAHPPRPVDGRPPETASSPVSVHPSPRGCGVRVRCSSRGGPDDGGSSSKSSASSAEPASSWVGRAKKQIRTVRGSSCPGPRSEKPGESLIRTGLPENGNVNKDFSRECRGCFCGCFCADPYRRAATRWDDPAEALQLAVFTPTRGDPARGIRQTLEQAVENADGRGDRRFRPHPFRLAASEK